MPIFWADITVKVIADSVDEAQAILYDSSEQMTSIYEGQMKVQEVNVEPEPAT